MPDVDAMSDAELVERANAGEREAFEALYRRYRDWSARLAYRFTGDAELAADVSQDSFLYLLGKFPGFELRAKLTTFLYPVVKHTAAAAQRKARRATPTSVDPPDVAEVTTPTVGRAELAAALDALPKDHRETLLMRVVDGMTVAEIALALGIPTGTVKSRVHNAIRALRADPRTRARFGLDDENPPTE